jgi:hypothetical protein
MVQGRKVFIIPFYILLLFRLPCVQAPCLQTPSDCGKLNARSVHTYVYNNTGTEYGGGLYELAVDT